MLSIKNFFILTLVPILFVVLIAPAEAQRRGPRVQKRAPQMRRSVPRPQVRRSAPRQVRRSAPRQVRRSAPRRQQVSRSRPRPQARRSAPSRPKMQRRAPSRQQRQVTRRPQRNRYTARPAQQSTRQMKQRRPQRQAKINRPGRQMNQRPQRQANMNRPGRQMNQRPQRQANINRPGRQMNQRPQRQANMNKPGRQMNQRPQRQANINRPGRQMNQRPQRQASIDRPDSRMNQRPGQQMTRRPARGFNTQHPGVSANRPGRRNIGTVGAQQGLAVRRPVRNTNTNVNVNNTYTAQPYNQPIYTNNRPVVYNNSSYCPPNYYSNYYSPVIYNDYCVRRRYRRYNNCGNIFWSLGFFVTRPYSYYSYNTVGYTNPIVYGDDDYYQPAPEAEGGPQPDAVTADQTVATAPTQPSLNTPEAKMLEQVSKYVEERSVDERFRINDAAFASEVWLLDLAQAPAVFELQDGLYSVVAGFEGTLGTSNVPSNVNVEFFVARTANGYEVRDAWITAANGIARNKLYQSPVYPDVKTWESGKKCPFSGQSMVPIPNSSEHG